MCNLSELVDRMRSGDANAENQLYELLRPYVRQLAEYQTKGDRNNVDASGITQETLLQVAKSIPEYRGSKDPQFKAWIKRILINKLTDEIRKSRPAASLDSTGLCGRKRNLVPDNASSPSQKAHRIQRKALVDNALKDALNALPQDQAQAVVMRHLDGLSIPEIANRLDRSEAATRQLIRRGIVKLGELLPSGLRDLS